MGRKWVALSAGLVLGAVLGGCGFENIGDLGNKNIRSNQVRYDANGNLLRDKRFADDQRNEMNRVGGYRLNSNNVVGSHKNYKIEMNAEISNKITDTIEAVKSAYVVVADRNAYVAVSLDEAEPKGNAKTMSRTNLGMSGNRGVETGRRTSSLATGQDRLTGTIKNEATSIVKSMRPKIEHVYVSADPDFVGRMNAYMNDAKLGYPVQHYIMEFNAMAERLFPAATNTESDDGIVRPFGRRSGRLLQ